MDDNYPPGFDPKTLDDSSEPKPEEDEHDSLEELTDDQA